MNNGGDRKRALLGNVVAVEEELGSWSLSSFGRLGLFCAELLLLLLRGERDVLGSGDARDASHIWDSFAELHVALALLV